MNYIENWVENSVFPEPDDFDDRALFFFAFWLTALLVVLVYVGYKFIH